MIVRYAAAMAAALFVMAAYSAMLVREGKQLERARVEKIGKRINVKANRARANAIKQPDRVLSKYCRDC